MNWPLWLIIYIGIGSVHTLIVCLAMEEFAPEVWYGTPLLAKIFTIAWLILTWPPRLYRDISALHKDLSDAD